MPLLSSILAQPSFKKSRLPSLYSDFAPLKVSNKDGYDANIEAWIQALNRSVLEEMFLSAKKNVVDEALTDEARASSIEETGSSCLCITTDQALSDRLTSNQWGKPLALASVEHEAVAKRAWIPRSLFLAQEESIYAPPSRMTNINLGAALRWGVSKFWTPSTPTKLSGAAFVVVANVELVANKLLALYETTVKESYSGHVTTRALFMRWCKQECPYPFPSEDMDVLLLFLSRDKGRLVQSKTSKTIKFVPAGASVEDVSISETDEAVAKLNESLILLDDQIASLSHRYSTLEIQARDATRQNQRTLALSRLRSRRQLESTLQSRIDKRAQVEAVLLKLDETATNMGLLQVMEQGGLALEKLLKSMGGIDRVHAITDSVAESMAEADEVQEAMTVGVVPAQDETDVEDAYEKMLAEATEKVKHVHIEEPSLEEPLTLPSVPATPVKAPSQPEEIKEEAKRKQGEDALAA